MKFFSRKQEVPALSSAETEIISIVETAKEMSLGMLLQTMIQGIPLDPPGNPVMLGGLFDFGYLFFHGLARM